MKGVSPVVAGVIMIAVAVVVGVMVSTWVTNWTSTQTTQSPICAVNTQYVVDSATFTSSTNITRVKVTNKGSEAIYDFTLVLDNTTNVMRFTTVTESPDTSSTSKLTQGNSVYITATVEGTFNRSICTTINEIVVQNTGCPSVSASTKSTTQA